MLPRDCPLHSALLVVYIKVFGADYGEILVRLNKKIRTSKWQHIQEPTNDPLVMTPTFRVLSHQLPRPHGSTLSSPWRGAQDTSQDKIVKCCCFCQQCADESPQNHQRRFSLATSFLGLPYLPLPPPTTLSWTLTGVLFSFHVVPLATLPSELATHRSTTDLVGDTWSLVPPWNRYYSSDSTSDQFFNKPAWLGAKFRLDNQFGEWVECVLCADLVRTSSTSFSRIFYNTPLTKNVN